MCKKLPRVWFFRVFRRYPFAKARGLSYHYENMPMSYTAIYHRCKTNNYQMKNCDIFFIFAQNSDCGYTITEAVLTSTHNLCFRAKIRK